MFNQTSMHDDTFEFLQVDFNKVEKVESGWDNDEGNDSEDFW